MVGREVEVVHLVAIEAISRKVCIILSRGHIYLLVINMIIYGLKGESKVDDKFKMISEPKNASQIISLIPCLYFWKICG